MLVGGDLALKIRAEKDFYAGLMYIALAAAFLWFGREYKMGAASRMGPGYFPLTLAWVLGGFGAISIVRSFFSEGSKIGALAWKPLLYITAGCLAFGFLIQTGGLVLALTALVVLSAMASAESQYNWQALLVLVGLILFCVLAFVKGLGVPMPIFGSWFDGVVPPSWQR